MVPQTSPKDEDHLQWYHDIPYAYCDTHLPKEHPKSNLSTIRLLSLFVDFSTPFAKAMWRRVNVSPSVLENWFDLIMKKGGENILGKTCMGMKFLSIQLLLLFRFELKEYLLSPTKFGSNSQPFQGREIWVNKILGKPLYEKALFAARVYDVVQVTSKLLIHIEKESIGMVWCSILTRWSIASHTIIATRGEFTFTLKNVNSTMLPYMIENSSVGTNIDSHSMEIGEKLKPQISRSRFYALVVE
ncbi:hypothetical protein Godav_004093, partial [Gossypium davidsonii]|nr:hypothetical protein [Gossypium davidsonii]